MRYDIRLFTGGDLEQALADYNAINTGPAGRAHELFGGFIESLLRQIIRTGLVKARHPLYRGAACRRTALVCGARQGQYFQAGLRRGLEALFTWLNSHQLPDGACDRNRQVLRRSIS